MPVYKEISNNELKQWLNEKKHFVLVDVRTEFEYSQFHIEGSILIPYDEIAARHKEMNASKDELIVVICRTGNRSAIAAEALARLGYKNLYNAYEGIISW